MRAEGERIATRPDEPAAQFGLWSAFCALAAHSGQNDAILAPGRASLSFAALKDRLEATKRDLNRCGIGRGDRVAMVLPNGPETAVCCLGAMACAIAAPLNPSYTAQEFRLYLGTMRPKALIVPAQSDTPAREVAAALDVRVIELAADPVAAGVFTLAGMPGTPCADARWNTDGDLGLILLTSGTMSRQKWVPLRLKQLLAYARCVKEIFGQGATDRTLLLMPLFHGAGVKSSCAIPLLNGASVVCLEGFEVTSFFKWLDVYRPTLISAGYAFHRAILEGVDAHREVVERSRVRFIRSGTGRLDPGVKERLESAFRAPVIEQYSSSETGLIACWRLPPEKGKPGTVGRAALNEVAIMGTDGAFVRTEEEGEIVVLGPGVFEGYLDDPEANAAAFVDGWYRTGDLGRLDADGFLTITGRAKEAINRGGEKVSPREVEEVIARHDAIAQVKVFGVAHPSLGEEVVAAVVLRAGASTSEADLRAFAAARLARFKVPRRIFFRATFPSGPTKKLDVRALVSECEKLLAAQQSEPAPAHDACSPTETIVRELWCTALENERIGLADDFFLVGGDSLRAAELLMSLVRTFGVNLPADAMYVEASTISKMAAEIDRLLAGAQRSLDDRGASGLADSARSAEPDGSARPLWSWSDLATLLTFVGLAPVAYLLPRAAWPAACDLLGRVHVATRGSRAIGMEAAVARLNVALTPEQLEREFLSGVYESVLMTLREMLPIAWHPTIRLHGAAHLVAARAAGRGAVLWTCPSPLGGLICKKALKTQGFDVVNLRSFVHPYSSTQFGMKVLNPIQTRIEDRYLAGTVTVRDDGGLAAFQQLCTHLLANRIVVLAANATEGTPYEMPFLGGTLALSLGAPTLAALHGAPLLPVFTAADGRGGFDVIVAPPVSAPARSRVGEAARELARRYADILEAHLRLHPAEWRGWFNRNVWSDRSFRPS